MHTRCGTDATLLAADRRLDAALEYDSSPVPLRT